MLYPIPSDVSAFDADGDGATDRLYVGDLGGQMWRVDFAPNRTATAGLTGIVGRLAAVSSSTADADKRKFFYPPSVIQVRGLGSESDADYNLVSAVTGNRSNPLNLSVNDRFYAFRDFALNSFTDTDSNGLADGYRTIRGDLDGGPADTPPAASFGDLTDLTVVGDLDDLTAIARTAFVAGDGYFIRLNTAIGEKGLTAPVTIAGKLFFTTYLPQGVVSAAECALAEGRGQLYGIDAISGAAIFNWDNSTDSNTLTHNDRTYILGSGIPSNPVPVFFPEKVMLLIGIGGGAEAVDPEITVPKGRTYWLQQQ
jgi:type IV pilus assembly protein PilY1